MTIGEKITQRRLAAHLSQEILAERLGVSTPVSYTHLDVYKRQCQKYEVSDSNF